MLITLLQIYRSPNVDEMQCGTIKEDLQELVNRDLISYDKNRLYIEDSWHLTEKGATKVKALLALMD